MSAGHCTARPERSCNMCMRLCRADALLVLNMVMAAAPQHVTGTYLLPALQHYAHLLAPSQRARSVSAGSMKNLLEVHFSNYGQLGSLCMPINAK